MLPPLYPGWHSELEPEFLCGWLYGLGRQRRNGGVALRLGCQEGITGQGFFFSFFFSLISIFFDVLLSFDSVVPYFFANGTEEMFRIYTFQPSVSLLENVSFVSC